MEPCSSNPCCSTVNCIILWFKGPFCQILIESQNFQESNHQERPPYFHQFAPSSLSSTLLLLFQSLSHVQLFCYPMDYSLPGSSSCSWDFQARILEWDIYFSGGSSWPRDGICISCIDKWTLDHWLSHQTLCIFLRQQPCILGFPGGTSGKELTGQGRRHKRHGFDTWVGKIPWRGVWKPTPIFLSGESHGQKPGGLQSTGSQRVIQDWSSWAHMPCTPSSSIIQLNYSSLLMRSLCE